MYLLLVQLRTSFSLMNILDEEPLLDVVVPNDWKYYAIGRAEYKPFREKQEDEETTLFVPPTIAGKYCEMIQDQQSALMSKIFPAL